jgi:DNA-binding transcriptional LysR family regulator
VDLDLTNRFVDLVKEGFDLAIRAGELRDSSLVARQLATAHFLLVASPDYLKRKGTPKTIHELKNHDCIVGSASGPQGTWRLYEREGAKNTVPISVSGRLAANHLGAVLHAAEAGLGVALLPREQCLAQLQASTLKEVLPGSCPSMGTVSAVYPSKEFMNPAVRALIDHIAEHLPL